MQLQYVLPRFARKDAPKGAILDWVLRLQFTRLNPSGIFSTDCPHLMFCKFCFCVSFALRAFLAATAFPRHVIKVLLLRSKHKVARVHATWVVASVAYHGAVWDFSIHNFIRRPMRPKVLPLGVPIAVILFALSAKPPPAAILPHGFIDFGPKSIDVVYSNHVEILPDLNHQSNGDRAMRSSK